MWLSDKVDKFRVRPRLRLGRLLLVVPAHLVLEHQHLRLLDQTQVKVDLGRPKSTSGSSQSGNPV